MVLSYMLALCCRMPVLAPGTSRSFSWQRPQKSTASSSQPQTTLPSPTLRCGYLPACNSPDSLQSCTTNDVRALLFPLSRHWGGNLELKSAVQSVRIASHAGGVVSQAAAAGEASAALPAEAMRCAGPVAVAGVREGILWLIDARGQV